MGYLFSREAKKKNGEVAIRNNNEVTKEEIIVNDKIKIGVITDIHRCEARSPGKVVSSQLQSFVDDVDERDVDFNVDLGDNARYRMQKCNDDAQEDLKFVVENLSLAKAPFYHALSDHDIDDVESFEKWKKVTNTPKSFYSLDVKDFHVIVLDTVSGDGVVSPVCVNNPICQKVKQELDLRVGLLKDDSALATYINKRAVTKEAVEREKMYYEKRFETIRATGKELALIERRDKGSILQNQLEWLENDLSSTDKDKVIVFSDHPLFRYQGKRKLYDIVNREKVAQIFKESGKEIVSVSGETHEWYEEEIEGVRYYLVGLFNNKDRHNWAILDWDSNGPRLEHVKKVVAL